MFAVPGLGFDELDFILLTTPRANELGKVLERSGVVFRMSLAQVKYPGECEV